MRPIPRPSIRDLPLKLLALAIALIVWFLASVERTYEVEFELELRPRGLPAGLTIVQESATRVRVRAQGRGWDLLSLYFGSRAIHLDLSRAQPGRFELKLDPSSVLAGSPLILKELKPTQVEFLVDELTQRQVELYIPIRGSPPPGLSLLRVDGPESVVVRGGVDQVASLRLISTEPLNLARLGEDLREWLRVVVPKGLRVEPIPESVQVGVVLEPTLRRELPGVRVRTEPGVRVSPPKARIVVSGPKSVVEAITPEALPLLIQTENLPPGVYELRAEILLPEGVVLEECEPALFRIRK